jgi:hypothetical protein
MGVTLPEHVWNAVLADKPAFSLLREEMSRSGGDLPTLAR